MQLKIGDRVRGKRPYMYEDAVGTVVEVTEPDPRLLMDDGTVRVAWDRDDLLESCYSYQSMVERLPEDFGSGDLGSLWW